MQVHERLYRIVLFKYKKRLNFLAEASWYTKNYQNIFLMIFHRMQANDGNMFNFVKRKITLAFAFYWFRWSSSQDTLNTWRYASLFLHWPPWTAPSLAPRSSALNWWSLWNSLYRMQSTKVVGYSRSVLFGVLVYWVQENGRLSLSSWFFISAFAFSIGTVWADASLQNGIAECLTAVLFSWTLLNRWLFIFLKDLDCFRVSPPLLLRSAYKIITLDPRNGYGHSVFRWALQILGSPNFEFEAIVLLLPHSFEFFELKLVLWAESGALWHFFSLMVNLHS